MYSPAQKAAKRRYYEKNCELVKAKADARRRKNPGAYKEAQRKWYHENPERRRELARQHYYKNREAILKKRALDRQTGTKIVSRARKYRGLPEPTRPQPKSCEICCVPFSPGKIHLDHDHSTGAFRGWLCNRCNLALGHFGDCIAGLERAVKYLRRVG